MRQFIKSYHLFLSQHWLRWIMYLVYPLLLIGLSLLLCNKISAMPLQTEARETMLLLVLFMLSDLIASLEVFVDSAIFGGIAAKDTNKLDYLKTSVRGMPILKKSLIADVFRRILSLTVIIGGCHLACPTFLSWINALTIILIVFCYIEVGLIITRQFPSILVTLITLSVITMIMPPTISLMLHTASAIKIILPLLLGIAIAVTGRWLILWKARNSYYDNRNEKGL